MSKKAELSQIHWQAIELISDGKMSLKEVAQAVGLKPDTIYKLYEGHDCMGMTGQLFRAELSKISQKQVSKIKDLTRDNKSLALKMINDFLRRKNSLEYQSDDDVKLITTVFSALCKASPNVEINNTSFSYVKGLSAEDLVHEYNKLRALAEGASVRGRVSAAGSGGSREVLRAIEPGSRDSQEPEAL